MNAEVGMRNAEWKGGKAEGGMEKNGEVGRDRPRA